MKLNDIHKIALQVRIKETEKRLEDCRKHKGKWPGISTAFFEIEEAVLEKNLASYKDWLEKGELS